VNEGYARVRPGTRWHRVAGVRPTSPEAYLAMYGREFEAACGYPVREFEQSLQDNSLEPSALTTEPPAADTMCRACVKVGERPAQHR